MGFPIEVGKLTVNPHVSTRLSAAASTPMEASESNAHCVCRDIRSDQKLDLTGMFATRTMQGNDPASTCANTPCEQVRGSSTPGLLQNARPE